MLEVFTTHDTFQTANIKLYNKMVIASVWETFVLELVPRRSFSLASLGNSAEGTRPLQYFPIQMQ